MTQQIRSEIRDDQPVHGDASTTYAAGLERLRRGDPVGAYEMIRFAAEQGLAAAQFSVGQMLREGTGVAKDPAEASRWYRLAAEQGHIKAQVNLGVMLSHGLGLRQDEVEAGRWYQRASNQGEPSAQYNLAVLFELGCGTPEDLVRAHFWFSLAEAGGEQLAAGQRRDVERRLSPRQIEESRRLFQEFRPQVESDGVGVAATHAVDPISSSVPPRTRPDEVHGPS